MPEKNKGGKFPLLFGIKNYFNILIAGGNKDLILQIQGRGEENVWLDISGPGNLT